MEQVLEQMKAMKTAILESVAEGKETVTTLDGEVKSLKEELQLAQKTISDLESQVRERKARNLPGLEDEKEKFSLFKAVTAITSGDWKNAEFEKSVFAETAKQKTLAQSTDSAGGYLVPAQAMQDLIELLRANTVVRQMGATVMDGLTGVPVEIPRQTGGATTFWVGENIAITPSDLTFGQLAMNPHTVAALVKLSNRLVRMSNPAAESLVRNDIGTELALAMDLAALRGTGADGQPVGIANTPGLGTTNYAASAATSGYITNPGFEQFFDQEFALANANALRGRVGWIAHPTVKRAISKIRVNQGGSGNNGEFLVNPILDSQQIQNYIGWPFGLTTQIPTNLGGSSDETEIYFGNWQDLIIAMWGGIEIMASQETSDAFAKNQTWVRILAETDIGIRHIESFNLGTNVPLNLEAATP